MQYLPYSRKAPKKERKEDNEAEKSESHAFPSASVEVRERAHATEVHRRETDRSEENQTQSVTTEPVRPVPALSAEQPL